MKILSPLNVTAAVLATCSLTAACQSPPAVIDNPKDGDSVKLSVGQPLTVKLTDMEGPKTDWAVTTAATGALSAMQHEQKAPEGGALGLDIYKFTGAAPGEQVVTFSYRQPDEPETPDNTMRVKIKVQS